MRGLAGEGVIIMSKSVQESNRDKSTDCANEVIFTGKGQLRLV
jgi:hypothetical protein